tara:strand:+ start:323 stop:1333 length:1011 start_codon:yes stop_codon:yes gene_type:complete
MTINKCEKKYKKYVCDTCDFLTYNKKDYNRHLLTVKHVNKIKLLENNNTENKDNRENKEINEYKDNKNENNFTCDCGKKYLYRGSLYNHKKKCFIITKDNYLKNTSSEDDLSNNIFENNINNELKSLVCKLINENNAIKNTLIEENKDLKEQLSNKDKQINELIPKIGDNITNNINQNFNINIFLNERCKDALNINDFIQNIKNSIDSLNFKNEDNLNEELNFLIIENLNKLGIFKRPLHCTDIKNETLYIKDNNSWLKDNNKDSIKRVIKNTASYQYQVLHKWIDKNPDIKYNESKKDCFAKSLSLLGKDNEKTNLKLIKSVCNNTYVNEKNLIE